MQEQEIKFKLTDDEVAALKAIGKKIDHARSFNPNDLAALIVKEYIHSNRFEKTAEWEP